MDQLRLATPADVPALHRLITESVRRLSAGFYTPVQVESALRFVIGLDSRLILDGTYYVVVREGGIVAAGGWSRRRTLHGGDHAPDREDAPLDPATDAARIRAFFVHPAAARQGLGRRLLAHCEAAAAKAGFRSLELVATLPGEPLYRALGFAELERVQLTLPDGVELTAVRMARPIVVTAAQAR